MLLRGAAGEPAGTTAIACPCQYRKDGPSGAVQGNPSGPPLQVARGYDSPRESTPIRGGWLPGLAPGSRLRQRGPPDDPIDSTRGRQPEGWARLLCLLDGRWNSRYGRLGPKSLQVEAHVAYCVPGWSAFPRTYTRANRRCGNAVEGPMSSTTGPTAVRAVKVVTTSYRAPKCQLEVPRECVRIRPRVDILHITVCTLALYADVALAQDCTIGVRNGSGCLWCRFGSDTAPGL